MHVDFYFGPGSRYSYLASTQLDGVAKDTGARFVWRALYSGELIARAGGTPKTPQDPAWRRRDARRWARRYGVAYVEPEGQADWPMVALACVAAARLGAGEAFGKAVLHLVYGLGIAPDLDRLKDLAAVCDLDPVRLSAEIHAPETAAAHERNLADALKAGAFGVPTFVTERGAVIWGQDRLPLLRDCLAMGDVAD